MCIKNEFPGAEGLSSLCLNVSTIFDVTLNFDQMFGSFSKCKGLKLFG